jgi:predicted transcriptional regulator
MITYELIAEDNSDEKHHRKSYSKSKLELIVGILDILVYDGSMNLSLIMHQTDLSRAVALENLSLLVRLKLVEEKTDKNELVYEITCKGEKTARFFRKTVSACLL